MLAFEYIFKSLEIENLCFISFNCTNVSSNNVYNSSHDFTSKTTFLIVSRD